MTEPMKIRAFLVNDTVDMKVMAKHPMESGLRRDEEGKRIPAHYIESLVVKCKDRVVLDAYLGMAVSENPYIAFSFRGAQKGDPAQFPMLARHYLIMGRSLLAAADPVQELARVEQQLGMEG